MLTTSRLAACVFVGFAVATCGCACPPLAEGAQRLVNLEVRTLLVTSEWFDEAMAELAGEVGSPPRLERLIQLSDSAASRLIRFAQSDRRAMSLSAPRVTMYDGQAGYVRLYVGPISVSLSSPPPDPDGRHLHIEMRGTIAKRCTAIDVAMRLTPVKPSDDYGFGVADEVARDALRAIPGGVHAKPARGRGTIDDRAVAMLIVPMDPVELDRTYEPGTRRLIVLVKPTILCWNPEDDREDSLFPGLR